MPFQDNVELTPKEYTLMETEKEENRLNREHLVTMKRLEIQLEMTRNEGDIKLRTLEAKWSSWLSIPKTIIKLPLYLILGVGYCIHAIRKQKPTAEFWKFIKS